MLIRHRQLAIAAGALGLIAALAPVATASAASTPRYPGLYQPPGSGPYGPGSNGSGSYGPGSHGSAPSAPNSTVSGNITFRDFPAGTTLTGGLGTIDETCVDGNNGRPFSALTGSTISAAIAPDTDLLPNGCKYRATRSTWRLYINTPTAFAGNIVFELSQNASGSPYYLACRSATGPIQCVQTGEFDLVVRPGGSLGGPPSGTGPWFGGHGGAGQGGSGNYGGYGR
jgi:hypothetical protein